MVEEIRLVSLELNNYRQYYGKQRVSFSSRNKGFTTLLGKNGEGKSNLLNALSWCFYRSEPHGKKSATSGVPIFNLKCIQEAPIGNIAKLSVRVLLQKGNTQYQISRTLTVLKGELEYDELSDGTKVMKIAYLADDKVPSGCEILPEKSNFVIAKKGPRDSDFQDVSMQRNAIDPETKIREILPKDLSVFYLLDGEFLEGFWNKPEKIEQGIEQISQLHLLQSTISHINSLRIPPKGFGKDVDNISRRMQMLQLYEESRDEYGKKVHTEIVRWKDDADEEDQYYHYSGNPKIEDWQHDVAKMKNRLKSISREIGDVNVASIKQLKQTYNEHMQDLEILNERRNIAETKYSTSLVNESPFIFLKNAAEKSIQIIELHQKKGELPNETKEIFISELLERGRCICDADLESKIRDGREDNHARIHVEKIRGGISEDVGLDVAIKIRYAFKHKLIDDYNSFLRKQFAEPRKEFNDLDADYDLLNTKIKGIRSKIGSAGDDKTARLINEQEHLLDLIEDANNEIDKEKRILVGHKKTHGELKFQLEKELRKHTTAQKLHHEFKIWDNASNHLQQIYDELKEEIRTGVQEKTWKVFISLLDNSNEFTKFRINPDYTVVLLDQNNANKIIDISAGQSLILTLAFVAALREPTGYRFPLVIDSPLGKIDGGIRYNIGTMISDYLPGEQITFLATDTEYVARIPLDRDAPSREVIPFGKLLEKKVSVKHFRIKKGKDGNSVISPAQLLYNKDRDGWEVV